MAPKADLINTLAFVIVCWSASPDALLAVIVGKGRTCRVELLTNENLLNLCPDSVTKYLKVLISMINESFPKFVQDTFSNLLNFKPSWRMFLVKFNFTGLKLRYDSLLIFS